MTTLSPELANSEEFKNFLIVDSMRQLTDLALSQGLIQSKEEATEYWRMFKDRIQNFYLNGKLATLDQVKSAIEKELEPVFQRSSVLVNNGVSEKLALAQCIVDWYKNNKSMAQTRQLLPKDLLTEQEINDLLSNANRIFNAGDYANAAVQYRQAAELEVADAQYNLGMMYDNGKGVSQDYKEAAKWYRLAADQGLYLAQYNLGVMYERGEGVPQDYKEAAKWYRLAADQGDTNAQNNLGLMYERGEGIPQDYNEATKWWKLAAKQGDDRAQFNLGRMYNYGRGVHQDYKEAIKLYLLSAEQGFVNAQNNLAVMYYCGQGTHQDYDLAYMWLNIAAATTDNEKQKNDFIETRDLVAKKMTASQIAKAQELARKRIANKFKKC